MKRHGKKSYFPFHKCILFLFWAWIYVVCCYSQPIEWIGESEYISIGDRISILEEKSPLTIEEVLSSNIQKQFDPWEKVIVNFGISGKYYWLKFEILNTSPDSLWLEIPQAFLPVCDFYSRPKNENWTVQPAGYYTSLPKKEVKHHFQIFPISSDKDTIEVLIRLKDYAHPFPIRLWEQNAYKIKANKQKIFFGIYTGIHILVILNNLLLFLFFQRFSYLHYSFIVFMHIINSAIMVDGYVLYFFPNTDLMNWAWYIGPINFANTLFYAIIFLEVKKYSKHIYWISLAFFFHYLTYLIWVHALSEIMIIILNSIFALTALFHVGLLGVITGRKGNKIGYYFALAYLLYFGLVCLELIYMETGSPAYIFEFSHISLAMLTEVLILAFLLFKRFEWERAEMVKAKLDAQELVIEKTRENEKILQDQNVILERLVLERTDELEHTNQKLSQTLLEIAEEQKKSEALLLNILPKEVARELKETGKTKPARFEDVSILFSDFVDFTRIAAQISSEKLVEELNELFSQFDDIMYSERIEKIQTVGDAYLAACGLPKQVSDHACRCVKAAQRMIQFLEIRNKSHSIEWNVRIGIHSGPISAGVVGKRKFAYDIFGDTINTASRMESEGQKGKINVSAQTYHLIKDVYECEYRGKISAKGKGKLDMYFVN